MLLNNGIDVLAISVSLYIIHGLNIGKLIICSLFRSELVEKSVSWFMGDQLEIHVAIDSFDSKGLKKCLKSTDLDPSINCCRFKTESCPHLQFVRHFLPPVMDNVAPLHLAVIVGNLEAVKILLRPRSDLKTPVSINQRIKGCMSTALHLAVLLNRREVISELVSSGADMVLLKDRKGYTAFELAVELKSPLVKTLYHEYYLRRACKFSFLFQYLSVEVKECVIKELLSLGDNLSFEFAGESIFIRILRSYHHSNLFQLLSFVLGQINLRNEERKLDASCNFNSGHRSFPSIFQANRPLFTKLRTSTTSHRKGYNCLAIIIIYCRRPSSERIDLMKLLIKHGSDVRHVTRKGRSLLHLCTKSLLSTADEAIFLIESGIPVKYTDIRQAIKYSRLDFLGIFLNHSNAIDLNLKAHLPAALSMIALKFIPHNIMSRMKISQEEYQSMLIKYFSILIQDHELDPSYDGEYYPLPLLHLLILKNKIFHDVYQPVIEFVVRQPCIDLTYEPRGLGNALDYSRSMRQYDIYRMMFGLLPSLDFNDYCLSRRRSLALGRKWSDSSCSSLTSVSTRPPSSSTSSGVSSFSCPSLMTSSCPIDQRSLPSQDYDVVDNSSRNSIESDESSELKNGTRVEFVTNSNNSRGHKRRRSWEDPFIPLHQDLQRQHEMRDFSSSYVASKSTTLSSDRRDLKREGKEWANFLRNPFPSSATSFTENDSQSNFLPRSSSNILVSSNSCHSLDVILEEKEEEIQQQQDSPVNKESSRESIPVSLQEKACHPKSRQRSKEREV